MFLLGFCFPQFANKSLLLVVFVALISRAGFEKHSHEKNFEILFQIMTLHFSHRLALENTGIVFKIL